MQRQLEPTAPELLGQAESLGELAFSTEEVAVILDMDPAEFRRRPDLQRAYLRGKLRAEGVVRANILQAAKQGSTVSQKIYLQLVAQSHPVE